MIDTLESLLREAQALLRAADGSVTWMDTSVELLSRIEPALARQDRMEQGLREIARISQDEGLYE